MIKYLHKDSKTRHDYINKETDTESKLGDYGVRKYDSFTGRFITPDVLFEKYAGWSPYHYSLAKLIFLLKLVM